jgi:arylsulfatase A-like enzyme
MNPSVNRRDFIKGLSLLALAPFVSASAQEGAASEQQASSGVETSPNVLIILFDALSATHMSLYGYPRATTPNLARFAERATVYHTHYAGGNFTTPGTASLLTSAYPWSHRAFNFGGTVAKSYEQHNLFSAFAGRGYTRIAYTHNPLANTHLYRFGKDIDLYLSPSEFCLRGGLFSYTDRIFPKDTDIASRSFHDMVEHPRKIQPSLFLSQFDKVTGKAAQLIALEKYGGDFPRGLPAVSSAQLFFLLEHAIEGMKAILNAVSQPYVAYFHLYPPHGPYNPRREFTGIFDDGWKPAPKKAHFFSQGISTPELDKRRLHYDEYLAYADAEFGRLLDYLEQSGQLDNTIVLFTSDHGELFERGIQGHDTPTLYDPVIHVPLLIARPGQQQREDVFALTSCIDLLPTLLHLTGQAIPEWCEGMLLPNIGTPKATSERSIFAIEAKSNPKKAPLNKATVSLRKGQYKLICYLGYEAQGEEFELYDLENDPEEREDTFVSQRTIAAELRNELETHLQTIDQPYSL